MRLTTVLLAGALCLPSIARSSTRWSETGAAVDEVVANTQTVAPAAALSPLVTETPFKSFRYPHVDAKENVTFIADDPYYTPKSETLPKNTNHGIYRSSAGGKLVTLVRARHTRVPGLAATFVWISGLQMDEKGIDFVFKATDTGGEMGYYHWTNGKLETIARTGATVLPGDKAALTEIEYGALNGTRVLYEASAGPGNNALVLHDLTSGTDQVLIRSGMAIPGGSGETFQSIAGQNWMTRDSIIFRASRAGSSTRSQAVTGDMGVYGWFGITDWTAGGDSFSLSKLQTVADWTTPRPLAQTEGSGFTFFLSAPIDGALTAFVGEGVGGKGVYFSRLPGGAVTQIVDDQTEMDGLFSGKFTEFSIWPSVIGKSVIFVGTAGSSDGTTAPFKGVFLYRTDTDELFVLADNRTQVEGKDVTDFEIAGHFLANDRFAVTVRFAGGASGVYLATIPAKSFRRLSQGVETAR